MNWRLGIFRIVIVISIVAGISSLVFCLIAFEYSIKNKFDISTTASVNKWSVTLEDGKEVEIETQTPLSVSEFSKRIKQKYPSYKDVDDVYLAREIVKRYPEYTKAEEIKANVLKLQNANATPQDIEDYVKLASKEEREFQAALAKEKKNIRVKMWKKFVGTLLVIIVPQIFIWGFYVAGGWIITGFNKELRGRS